MTTDTLTYVCDCGSDLSPENFDCPVHGAAEFAEALAEVEDQ